MVSGGGLVVSRGGVVGGLRVVGRGGVRVVSRGSRDEGKEGNKGLKYRRIFIRSLFVVEALIYVPSFCLIECWFQLMMAFEFSAVYILHLF